MWILLPAQRTALTKQMWLKARVFNDLERTSTYFDGPETFRIVVQLRRFWEGVLQPLTWLPRRNLWGLKTILPSFARTHVISVRKVSSKSISLVVHWSLSAFRGRKRREPNGTEAAKPNRVFSMPLGWPTVFPNKNPPGNLPWLGNPQTSGGSSAKLC